MAVIQSMFAPFIPGPRLIDGTDLNNQFDKPHWNANDGLTATVGGGQTNALLLTARINRVSTVASAADSIKLPTSAAGKIVFIMNDGANSMQVYGSGTDTINDVATATGVAQPAASLVVYVGTVNGKWYSQSADAGLFTSLVLQGATSGSTIVTASAIASGALTLPAVTGTVASTTGSNLYIADLKRCSASVTANATTTYANVTGLSFTVVPGTYEFVCRLPSTVASGTGGIKYAFNYTTAVLSAIEATGRGYTASAVAVQHTTTTTTQTDIFTQAAVVIFTEISGTMVVTTGGTVDVQVAQNTSNASNTVALIGASAQFTRIA